MDAAGVDIFATKGLEYVLVIGYLLLLVSCWRFVAPRRADAGQDTGRAQGEDRRHRFRVPGELLYHQGHAWVEMLDERRVRVGMDDFAQALFGMVKGLVLPPRGTWLQQGEQGWHVGVEGGLVPMLSPVEGEVVAVNGDVRREPSQVNAEPYGAGWLLEIEVDKPEALARNLLAGRVARAWVDESAARLNDGALVHCGVPLDELPPTAVGLAKTIYSREWQQALLECLLSGEGVTARSRVAGQPSVGGTGPRDLETV